MPRVSGMHCLIMVCGVGSFMEKIWEVFLCTFGFLVLILLILKDVIFGGACVSLLESWIEDSLGSRGRGVLYALEKKELLVCWIDRIYRRSLLVGYRFMCMLLFQALKTRHGGTGGIWKSAEDLNLWGSCMMEWNGYVNSLISLGITINSSQDQLLWGWDIRDGVILAKKAYEEIALVNWIPSGKWWNECIWKLIVPYKIIFFSWLLFSKKILVW